MGLIKKLRKAKKEASANEKPAMVRTHLRDMIIVPEMIGSVVGVYVSKDSPTAAIESWFPWQDGSVVALNPIAGATLLTTDVVERQILYDCRDQA